MEVMGSLHQTDKFVTVNPSPSPDRQTHASPDNTSGRPAYEDVPR